MTDKRTVKAAHVAIVADIPNGMIEQPFEQLLRTTAQYANSPIKIESDSVYATQQSDRLAQELDSKMRKNYDVVVAMLGIPNTSNYPNTVHTMMECWAKHPHSVLLVASPKARHTRQIIDQWAGWQALSKETNIPVEKLKESVRVNPTYIVAQSGADALEQVHQAVIQSEAHRTQIAPYMLEKAPAPRVRTPDISESQEKLLILGA